MAAWTFLKLSFRSVTEFGSPGNVPESCCTQPIPGCGSVVDFVGNISGLYQAGCLGAVQGEMAENVEMVVAAIAGVAALQVLGVCLACCLARSVQVEHCQI
jgi:hypothetical protein